MVRNSWFPWTYIIYFTSCIIQSCGSINTYPTISRTDYNTKIYSFNRTQYPNVLMLQHSMFQHLGLPFIILMLLSNTSISASGAIEVLLYYINKSGLCKVLITQYSWRAKWIIVIITKTNSLFLPPFFPILLNIIWLMSHLYSSHHLLNKASMRNCCSKL